MAPVPPEVLKEFEDAVDQEAVEWMREAVKQFPAAGEDEAKEGGEDEQRPTKSN